MWPFGCVDLSDCVGDGPRAHWERGHDCFIKMCLSVPEQ